MDQPSTPQSKTDARHAQLAERARTLMEENLAAPLGIEQLAEACSSSPTVLKESFRKAYGMPIYQWYRARRMERAKELLLAGNLTIAGVAAAVGYSNPSKFSKAFRDCAGVTPSAWLAQQRGESAARP